MKNSPVKFYLVISAIFLNLVLMNGCRSTENTNVNGAKTNAPRNGKRTSPSDNVEDLLNLIKLPVVPNEVVWAEEETADKKKITAVLRYEPKTSPDEPDNLLQIVNLLEKYKQPDPSEVGIEDWFPEELKAKAQLSGMEVINGTGYGANEFFNIPYGNGKITRIEGTNYFVLELAAN